MESPSENGITKLLEMQKQLMEKVPHAVRLEVYPKVLLATEVIKNVLLYLGSCGHKPWRPEPLAQEVRMKYWEDVVKTAKLLGSSSEAITKYLDKKGIGLIDSRQLISALGITEEAMEYLDSLRSGHINLQLEEITDPLFFYLEMVIQSGFSWKQIQEQYVRKHAENLKRYEDAKEGDYSWDKRSEGKL